MTYSYQTFTTGQVLTATECQQLEDNTRDHTHGNSGVNAAMQNITVTGSLFINGTLTSSGEQLKNGFPIGYGGGRYCKASTSPSSAYSIAAGLQYVLFTGVDVNSEGIIDTSSSSTATFTVPAASLIRFSFHAVANMANGRVVQFYLSTNANIGCILAPNSAAVGQFAAGGGEYAGFSATMTVASGQYISIFSYANSGYTMTQNEAILEILQ